MINHIYKEQLPNPFAGTNIVADANKMPDLPAVRQPTTITVKPTPVIKTPFMPVKQPLNIAPDNGELAGHFSELFADMFGDAINSLGKFGELFAQFFASLANSFATGFAQPSLAQRERKPMPIATYAVPAKLGEMVFSRINNDVFGAVASGYKDKVFMFSVPIKMYKITEAILRDMQISYERIK